MPKPIGPPITITNGQPQREVSHYNVTVMYDTAGVATFLFNSFSCIRLRASDGSVIYETDQAPLISLADGQIPAVMKNAFNAIVTRLDTV